MVKEVLLCCASRSSSMCACLHCCHVLFTSHAVSQQRGYAALYRFLHCCMLGSEDTHPLLIGTVLCLFRYHCNSCAFGFEYLVASVTGTGLQCQCGPSLACMATGQSRGVYMAALKSAPESTKFELLLALDVCSAGLVWELQSAAAFHACVSFLCVCAFFQLCLRNGSVYMHDGVLVADVVRSVIPIRTAIRTETTAMLHGFLCCCLQWNYFALWARRRLCPLLAH